MSQHYPEALIGDTDDAWCGKCGRITKHLIVRHSEHAGRLGHCLEHEPQKYTKKQQKQLEKKERERTNPKLF